MNETKRDISIPLGEAASRSLLIQGKICSCSQRYITILNWCSYRPFGANAESPLQIVQ